MSDLDPYKRLQLEYYNVKRILATLTPESGAVYNIYQKRMDELMTRYKPKDRTPKPKMIVEGRNHKKRPPVVDLSNLPVNFKVSF